ncbi:hypothetical protein BGI32_07900 [Snodgrassella alvi]|uniref:Integrase catalytic domain-containing protein n=1 Tax=Snodgrassella alvi TaxID=1196083 RepID=A0A2N9WT02_9NEIS|nr:hypothetical protein [Snodgrassella alvi]PIT14346.1 hypothetical protein BGI32_07900 [Snodgrassella alvi]
MDFMSDSSRNQRVSLLADKLTAISMPSASQLKSSTPLKVLKHRYLDKLAEYYSYPLKIQMDNGSEFTGETFINWAKLYGIAIDYIQLSSQY